jgi:hypothetical protein
MTKNKELVLKVEELQKELELVEALHKVAVRERDYERLICSERSFEIKRLRSLCLRAAEEIEMLDDIIIRNNLEEQMNEEYPGMASVNLLSRLRGRIKGGYVENYPELTEGEND